ncbi:MAG: pyridoxal-phosphate dependent enzyme [Deltaproteobacteria bacterium]|jgi:threonine synthase|nr:pyridoxal-phosphate dependent enzyme [Deltaproteobacteria bacterium]
MKIPDFPQDIQDYLLPTPGGDLGYECLRCGERFSPDRLLYVCPSCGGLLLLEDRAAGRLSEKPGSFWRKLFDYRLLLNDQALKGVFAFHEFLAPLIPLEDIVYLGEGHTPAVAAPPALEAEVGAPFYVKLDGLNPSASFKDRGMAAALSHLKYLLRTQNLESMMAVCASTGDTSAAAALYGASLGGKIKSAVLLPKGLVTPQQLSQPLGAGARVFELPGVFDDAMKVVERLSEDYQVALLNSKNPWRILGQESYAFEVARQFDYETDNLVLFAPVGNAGNITAILGGLLKFYARKLIAKLPKVVAVQSERANPVFLYYNEPPQSRVYRPVTVGLSVAQAAMIGDPVSFPRLQKLAEIYLREGGGDAFAAIQVTEEEIMEATLQANRRGLTVCTQGGESLAGFKAYTREGKLAPGEVGVLDSTAHALKFMEFQNAYFASKLKEDYGVTSKEEYINAPRSLESLGTKIPSAQSPLNPEERARYAKAAARRIAATLGLAPAGKAGT